MRNIMLTTTLALLVGPMGCTEHKVRHEVEPIEVKPITVNVNVRIDRELDEFFDYEEEMRRDRTIDQEGAGQ